jgi:hypothetical protein
MSGWLPYQQKAESASQVDPVKVCFTDSLPKQLRYQFQFQMLDRHPDTLFCSVLLQVEFEDGLSMARMVGSFKADVDGGKTICPDLAFHTARRRKRKCPFQAILAIIDITLSGSPFHPLATIHFYSSNWALYILLVTVLGSLNIAPLPSYSLLSIDGLINSIGYVASKAIIAESVSRAHVRNTLCDMTGQITGRCIRDGTDSVWTNPLTISLPPDTCP